MSKLLTNLRQKVLDATYHNYKKDKIWKAAFSESRPKYQIDSGKSPTDNLHPVDKSHLKDEPIIFSKSKANVGYKATKNFYGRDDDSHLPKSHNYFINLSLLAGVLYCLWIRDDGDNEGFKSWVQPVHETLPKYAIPLLKSAITENKKAGKDTSDLEKKLAEYMKNPEKYGGQKSDLVEN